MTASAAERLPSSSEWRTDLSRRSIELSELLSGGPPKDGIPSINAPSFVSVEEAAGWLDDREPVQVVTIDGETRVYPVQILIWHELVNDRIGDTPILVSYCPLCLSAIVFDRRVGERTLEFGVSGMLRDSDMVMFDRRTESLWQQLTGEAIVGELWGETLKIVSSQVVDFGSVRKAYPKAKTLSRDTGHRRPYGDSPYAGYEAGGRTIFPVKFRGRGSLKKLDRLLTITAGEEAVAYKMKEVGGRRLIPGEIVGRPYVVFLTPEGAGALDRRKIVDSKPVGSVGVFSPVVDGRALGFQFRDGSFFDEQTGSEWNLFGEAVAGELEGRRLEPLEHGVFFAFAWLTFHPRTQLLKAPRR